MSNESAQATERPRAADRILKSARELFYAQGIRAVGVDEIVTHAGVAKPSLYRSFPSKDQLAASYLELYEAEFWARFDGALGPDTDDPRRQLLDYLTVLGLRAQAAGYRGCGLSNAVIEYPEAGHPARRVAEAHKRKFRARLHRMAKQMGASDPAFLGDALMLLIEGAFSSGQLFRGPGPAESLVRAASLLIDAAAGRPEGSEPERARSRG
jgi:AcrR family transcriptional regulator